MGFVVGFLLQCHRHLRVDGGGGEVGVAENELDRLQVHAVFEPVGGDGVADSVGRDAGAEARLLQVGDEEAVDRAGCEPVAEPVEEEGLLVLFFAVGAFEILLNPITRIQGEGNDPLLFSLPFKADELLIEVDVRFIDLGELGHAETGGVEEFHHSPVAKAEVVRKVGLIEKHLDLIVGKGRGQLFLELRKLYLFDRIFGDPFLPHGVPEVGAEGRKLAGARFFRFSGLMEACEVLADVRSFDIGKIALHKVMEVGEVDFVVPQRMGRGVFDISKVI